MAPRAKLGEGIVVIVDVGPGVRAGTENTFFNQSKKCLINILQRKIFAEKCIDSVGIVLFGTDDTENNLAQDDQYQHITVLQEPKHVDWGMITKAEQIPRGFAAGDWIDALVVAMDILHDPDGIRFETKKIVLLTDFSSEFSASQADVIIQGIKNSDIDLSIIGPELEDDDDDDTGYNPGTSNGAGPSNSSGKLPPLNWNGKPKSKIQLAGEALATNIVTEVGGLMCSFDEAIPQLIFYQKKASGSSNWNAVMDIGPDLQIPITGRIKIRHATSKTWKKSYAQDETAEVMKEVSYHKQDDAQTPVDERDIIDGYRYGTTLVPFSEEDAQLRYNSGVERAVLNVLGFSRSSNVPLSYRSGDQVLIITARDYDDNAAIAVSAIIHALAELDMVAVTRKIYRKNCNPVIGALYPEITNNYECLVWVPLPYQEDVRAFAFPSLQRVTEKITSNERDAMDNLINSMDLTAQDEDDDEELEPQTVLNPQLQHLFNSLTHRAINPQARELPPPEDHIMRILSPPESVRENQEKVSKILAATFPTKKIVRRTKREREDLFANGSDATDAKKARTDGDDTVGTSDLTSTIVTTITTASPVQDFRALLEGEAPNFYDICRQMESIILQLLDGLDEGMQGNMVIFNKVLDCIKAFRREVIHVDHLPYNDFLPKLKQLVKGKKFTQLWDIVLQDNLGLITNSETLKSDKTKDDAEQFLKMDDDSAKPPTPPPAQAEDYDDLLDDL